MWFRLIPRLAPIVSERNSQESKYVLTACLEPVEVGKEFSKLPPHITILPPCNITEEKLSDFINGISQGAEDWLPISGETGCPVLFGKNHDTEVMPVHYIEPGVFANAIVTADKLGIAYDKSFSINYFESNKPIHYEGDELTISCSKINHPHITNFENLKPDEEIRIQEMQLFCLSALKKKVVATFNNQGFNYEK